MTLLQIDSPSHGPWGEGIEALVQKSYPKVVLLLKQIKGVGTLIALTFRLTLEDPHRFGKSRDVGGYLGLHPGHRKSGESEPQMHNPSVRR
jgi:transposase